MAMSGTTMFVSFPRTVNSSRDRWMSRLAGLKMSKWHGHGVSTARDMRTGRPPGGAPFPALAVRGAAPRTRRQSAWVAPYCARTLACPDARLPPPAHAATTKDEGCGGVRLSLVGGWTPRNQPPWRRRYKQRRSRWAVDGHFHTQTRVDSRSMTEILKFCPSAR